MVTKQVILMHYFTPQIFDYSNKKLGGSGPTILHIEQDRVF